MRILFINDAYEEVGGAETYVLAIRKYIENEGHELFYFAYGAEKRERNVLVVAKPQTFLKRSFTRFLFNYRFYRELKRYILEVKPDVIHVHNNYFSSLSILAALWSFRNRIPIVQTVHDWGLLCPTSWSVYKKSLKVCSAACGIAPKCVLGRCLKLHHFIAAIPRNKLRFWFTKKVIRSFIAPSSKLAEYLRNYGFKNVSCLNHFIDDFSSELDLKHERNLVLYAGRLTVNKGIRYLLAAMPKIIQNCPKAKLVVVGDLKDDPQILDFVKGLGIEDAVKFTGRIKREEVSKYYRKARMLVMPSIWMENSPFVLYECLNVGRPIVASSRGGIVDLVRDGVNGILVEATDSGQIADAVLKMLKDDDLFKRYSMASYEIARKEFGPKMHVRKLLDIYDKAITSS